MVNIPCENYICSIDRCHRALRSLKSYLPGVKKASW